VLLAREAVNALILGLFQHALSGRLRRTRVTRALYPLVARLPRRGLPRSMRTPRGFSVVSRATPGLAVIPAVNGAMAIRSLVGAHCRRPQRAHVFSVRQKQPVSEGLGAYDAPLPPFGDQSRYLHSTRVWVAWRHPGGRCYKLNAI